MNIHCATIIVAKDLNTLIVKTDSGRRMLVSIYCGYSWDVIKEFHEFGVKNLVGRRVVLDMEAERIFADKDGNGGVKWQKAFYLD